MGLIALSASKRNEEKKPLLYEHTEFNKAIEVVIKMLDRLDSVDRVFAQDEE